MAGPATGVVASTIAAISAFFNWVLHRSQLKNSKEMQEAAKAQHQVEVQNKIENAVAEQNTDETRKMLAE